MPATDFEYRHQTLLHLLTVGLAFLTYVVAPDRNSVPERQGKDNHSHGEAPLASLLGSSGSRGRA